VRHRPTAIRTGRARRPQIVAIVIAALAALSACSTDDGRVLRPPADPDVVDVPGLVTTTGDAIELASVVTGLGGFAVASPVVAPGGSLPFEHTCDGAGTSPPLSWTAPPEGTAELAVVLTARTGFVHWIVLSVAPTAGAVVAGEVPPGGRVAVNGTGAADYFGPCPPTEAPEVYAVTIHALAEPVETTGPDAGAVLAAIEDATLDRTTMAVTATGGPPPG